MTRRRLIVVLLLPLLVFTAVLVFVVVSRSHGRAREAARQTAPIISDNFPAMGPSPSLPTVSHEGLRVRVRELGIDLPIVEGDGCDAPLYEAAHYPGMPWPGDGERSMIYAHARAGMSGPLSRARVGEHVEILSSHGKARRYEIREYYRRWPITDLKWLRAGDHEEVVLVTCTTYNYNDPRIVAVGEPA